jgi:hypothetical protein
MISWYWLIPAAWVGAMAMLLMIALCQKGRS